MPTIVTAQTAIAPTMTAPTMTAPIQHLSPRPTTQMAGVIPLAIQVNDVVRAQQAREKYQVDGSELTVAVLDTGLRTSHIDFRKRVLATVNFTADNQRRRSDVTDGNGHGTNVTGIIAANGRHVGIAPNTNLISLKVLPDQGKGNFEAVRQALGWVLEHHEQYRITALCLSLGDGGNHVSDQFSTCPLRPLLQALRQQSVAVVAAAGNDFYAHRSDPGMCYPAILEDVISVGAVYDDNIGECIYPNGAVAFSTGADVITPFSQRLHQKHNPHRYTDIFAPGAATASSGIQDDYAQCTLHGTSQAAPVVTGVILLMQQYYWQLTKRRPSIASLVRWLRASGTSILDGDDEHDNVANSHLPYVRLDAFSALQTMATELRTKSRSCS